MKIKWSRMIGVHGICSGGVIKAKKLLSGDGITLAQARKAVLAGKISFGDCARVACALNLPRWKLALGRCVAVVHPLSREYYSDIKKYRHNQRMLREGKLERIDGDDALAARAAASVAASDASAAAWAAAWAAVAAARAAASDADWTAYVVSAWVTDIDKDKPINIFFDTLDGKCV